MGKRQRFKRIARTLRRALARETAGESAVDVLSPPSPSGASPWAARPEAERDAIEGLDRFAETRNRLRMLADDAGEWAGIPLPIEGEDLAVEPSYRFAGAFNGTTIDVPKAEAGIRNYFWSHKYRCKICVFEEGGKVTFAPMRGSANQATMLMRTLGCSFAWGIEQESVALRLLRTMVKHHAFKCYLLTGSFLERSPRSDVTYMFRKLRPTLAIISREDEPVRVLAALCMHPIGYYRESWAGAMCPTDDVIAHLSLMRGDEHMFWKRSNQHPALMPEAGL